MTPPQVDKRRLLGPIMPGCKITLPSSHCIVSSLLLLLVGFIPPEETHNVTPLSLTDEWKNAMLSLGVDGEQFPTTNDKLPPPPPGCVAKLFL